MLIFSSSCMLRELIHLQVMYNLFSLLIAFYIGTGLATGEVKTEPLLELFTVTDNLLYQVAQSD